MNDAQLLDEIKQGFGLKNDAQIAGLLGITRTTIHNVRYKGKRLGIKPRLLLLDKIAFLRTIDSIESWAQMLTNAGLANRIRNISNSIAQNRAIANLPSDDLEIAEKDLLEEVKRFLKCSNDEELAAALGLARNTISAIRSGDTSLGPEPRLKILNLIEPFNLEKMQLTLESTDLLIEAIRNWSKENN